MREMPEKTLPVQRSSFTEEREQVEPVFMLVGTERQTGRRQDGGIEVGSHDRLRYNSPRWR